MMNHNLDRWQDSLKHKKSDTLRIYFFFFSIA
jgi:hypothetical protein